MSQVINFRDATVTIGTTPVIISEDMQGSQRQLLTIVNTSAGGQDISLGFGIEAVDGSGIVLYPTGTYSETLDNRFTPTNLRLFAVSSAAGGTIAIHERIISGD